MARAKKVRNPVFYTADEMRLGDTPQEAIEQQAEEGNLSDVFDITVWEVRRVGVGRIGGVVFVKD